MQLASSGMSQLAMAGMLAGKYLDSNPDAIADLPDFINKTPPEFDRIKAKKFTPAQQNHIGTIHSRGKRKSIALKNAADWFLEAAKAGDAIAQYNLAGLYYHGEGGKTQNYNEAAKWVKLAADQGLALAQNALGFSYRKGQGVEQDYVQAKFWFDKAIEQGLAVAKWCLGVMYESGEIDGINYRKAFELFSEAADENCLEAINNLGAMYYNGDYVKRDFNKAAEYFRKTAMENFAEGQCCLGMMLLNGSLGNIDKIEAMSWLKKSAAQGDKMAEFAMNADLSPIIIDEFDSKGKKIAAKSKFELYPALRNSVNEDGEIHYYLLDNSLGLRVWAESRDELIATIKEDLDFIWGVYAKAKDAELTTESIDKKNLLLATFSEE
ncbi:MAG: tetratricopeptide repeat protein [Alphaproteobacteria bacterium]|nr:tetratricopeptide repeat protein [Alphaproteobacteria bacterium]